jgi:hypothetical protein
LGSLAAGAGDDDDDDDDDDDVLDLDFDLATLVRSPHLTTSGANRQLFIHKKRVRGQDSPPHPSDFAVIVKPVPLGELKLNITQ